MHRKEIENESRDVWYVSRTFRVREDQALKMVEYQAETNWSAVVRNAIERKLLQLEKEKRNGKPG